MPAPLYDWDKWFSKEVFTLEPGVDFTCGSGTMCQMIRNVASERRLRVNIYENTGTKRLIKVKVAGSIENPSGSKDTKGKRLKPKLPIDK